MTITCKKAVFDLSCLINLAKIRDRRQITFVTSSSMEYQQKLNEKYTPVLQFIPSFEGR